MEEFNEDRKHALSLGYSADSDENFNTVHLDLIRYISAKMDISWCISISRHDRTTLYSEQNVRSSIYIGNCGPMRR